MPAWNELSVLVAGCGSVGRRHSRLLKGFGLKDLRICDPAAPQRKMLTSETPVAAEFDSYEAGLASRPDAVFICTPPKMHIPMAIHALKSGIHVFSEKPLSDSLEGVEPLAAAIKESGRKFMVGFCFRYHEGLAKAKSYLDQGRIGRLVGIRCRMGEHFPTVRPDYKTLFTAQYSGAFDLTHEMDLACWFAGDNKITKVKSIYGKYSDVDMKAPDTVEILVAFGSACVANIHLDFFSRPRTRITELLGAEGAIAVEFASWDECAVSIYEAKQNEWRSEKMKTERDFMFRSEDEEFLRAVASDKPIRLGLEEACKSMQIVEAATRDGA